MLCTAADARPRAARAGRRAGRVATGLLFVAVALALLPFADFDVGGHDPWAEIGRLLGGLASPDFAAPDQLGRALALTVAFALCGVFAGAAAGFLLAPFYKVPAVRMACIAVRSVHELFWALILLQVTGLGAMTGVLALALPYAGIFAKVFAEYVEEADPRAAAVMPAGADTVSVHAYARLPQAIRAMGVYTLYRVECGLRSSAVLGFVGLPTLGFQLDTFFRQGMYGAVGAVLLLYFLMIGTVRHWMRWRLLPLYLVAAGALLVSIQTPPIGEGALLRLLTQDIVPAPLRDGDLFVLSTWAALGDWLSGLVTEQVMPGLGATLVVAQIALVVAGLVALAGFPVIVPRLVGRAGAFAGHVGLVIGRSTPEYMLAYVLLQIFGPSMLPAVVALGVHNGAIIAHLLGRQSEDVFRRLRADAPRGLDLYAYELLPRLYGTFLALCFYRWEIIVRESAILGLLGIATLGFHVDAAIQELRLDRVLILLLATMLATVAIDCLSRALRTRLGLRGITLRAG